MKKLSDTLKEMGVEFTFPIEIKNEAGKETYFENSRGYWYKRKYDSEGNETYYENNDDYWYKSEYDSSGNETYHVNSDGYWRKSEYNPSGKETYHENSDGRKTGTPRSAKTCEGKVVEVDGVKYELKTINN
jgi:hypothetical protein